MFSFLQATHRLMVLMFYDVFVHNVIRNFSTIANKRCVCAKLVNDKIFIVKNPNNVFLHKTIVQGHYGTEINSK